MSRDRAAKAAFLAIFLGSLTAGAAEYQIDPSHSEILFKVRHLGINTVTGRFDAFRGSFDVDLENIEATRGEAVIEAQSVNTNHPRRDNHLRGDDFFNVEQFPEIRFVSRAVRNVNRADSTCDLTGDLTIRDVTREITLRVKGGGIVRAGGKERAAFAATGALNRFDYGLKWNKVMETGTLVASNEVALQLNFEGVRSLENDAEGAQKPPR